MKKFVTAMVILVLIGAVIIGIGCAVYFGGDIRIQSKDANYVEKTFESDNIPDTFEVRLAGAHNLVLQRGEKTSLKYSDSEISQFSVSEEGGTLKAIEKSTLKFWERLVYREKSTDVVLTLPEGAKISLNGKISGAANVTLPSWEYGAIDVTVSGASNIEGNGITAGDVKFHVSGASNVVLNGVFGNLNLNTSGSGNFEISGSATELDTKISGASELKFLNFDCPDIDIDCSGTSEITLRGTGAKLQVKASGFGEIEADNFKVAEAYVDASGSVKATLNVSEKLSAKGSGSVKIRYYGDPKVEQSGSGSFSVTKIG